MVFCWRNDTKNNTLLGPEADWPTGKPGNFPVRPLLAMKKKKKSFFDNLNHRVYNILSCSFLDNVECQTLTKVYIQTFLVTRARIWIVLETYFTKIQTKVCTQPQHFLELYWQRNASKTYKFASKIYNDLYLPFVPVITRGLQFRHQLNWFLSLNYQ